MYKLKYKIKAHKSDARSVYKLKENFFASGSRDSTCKIYKKDIENDKIEEIKTINCEEMAISCVLCFGDENDLKIALGTTKSIIFVFDKFYELVYKFEGHNQNITCLTYCDRNNHLISGSWDCQIKIWDIYNGNLIKTLSDHEKAIWCLKCVKGYKLMLSGSADTKIILWKDYYYKKQFIGHKQSIRDIIILNDKRTFISCGNDNMIIKWDIINGTKLHLIGEHDNFIYSLLYLSENCFISVGEDGIIKIWENDNLNQEIKVSCSSLWTVDCINKNEFIVGCSDGYIRVYTNDTNFKTPIEDIILKTENSINNIPTFDSKISNAQSLENDPNIPDISVGLVLPGKTDGQVTLVRNNGQIQVYEWKINKEKWELMGDMLSSVNDQNINNKVYFEGKEYDYVFDVDLEGMKMAKLPYNRGDDKYKTAELFLSKNGLHTSEIYVNQIIEFLNTNVPKIDEIPIKLNELQNKLNVYFFKYSDINLEGLIKKLNQNSNKLNQLNQLHLKILKDEIDKLLKLDNIASINPISSINIENFPFEQLYQNIDLCDDEFIIIYLDLLRILSLDILFTNKFINDEQLIKLWIRFLSEINLSNEKIIFMLFKIILNMFFIINSNELCTIVNMFVEQPDLLLFLDNNVIWENNKTQIAICTFLYNFSMIFLSIKNEFVQLLRQVFDKICKLLANGLNIPILFTNKLIQNSIQNSNQISIQNSIQTHIQMEEKVFVVLMNSLKNILYCKTNFLLSEEQKQMFQSILTLIIQDKTIPYYEKVEQDLNGLLKLIVNY